MSALHRIQMKGRFRNIFKELNLFINLVYLLWRNNETQKLLFVCVQAVLYVAYVDEGKDGVVG